MKYTPPTGSSDPNAPYLGKNPAIGQQGSKVPPIAVEATQREIVDVIADAGLTPTHNVLQLSDAIDRKVSSALGVGIHLTVTGSPISEPPGSPADGNEYPIAAAATGAWAGKDGQIARWDATVGVWKFSPCRLGRVVKVADTDTFYRRTGAAWSTYSFGANVNPSVAWGGITGTLAYQSDLAAALDGKVALNPAGGALQEVGGSFRALVAATGGILGARTPNGGVDNTSGIAFTGGASYLDLKNNAGAVAVRFFTNWNSYINTGYGLTIGSSAHAAERLDVHGNAVVRGTITATSAVKIVSPYGNVQIGNGWRAANNGLTGLGDLIFQRSTDGFGANFYNAVTFAASGALGFNNDQFGVSQQVLKSNGSAGPPSWAGVIDLLTASELRSKIGGKTILAVGTISGLGVYTSAVTFPTAEPDTSYQVAGITAGGYDAGGGAVPSSGVPTLSAKTVYGCTVNPDWGVGVNASTFWIIYR